MKKQKRAPELPPDVQDDYVYRSFLTLLDGNIHSLTELVNSGVDNFDTYNKAVGRLWGLTFAREQLIKLAQNAYKELNEEDE
jgi:hypothetical protein